MAGAITASEPSSINLFTGLSPRQSGKLMTALRRESADPVRKGRPWSLALEDRVLLVAAYWRTNLTLRQLAPLFGVSKSAADRINDDLGPALALQQRKRFRRNTALIVDGTLMPTRDHTVAEQSKRAIERKPISASRANSSLLTHPKAGSRWVGSPSASTAHEATGRS